MTTPAPPAALEGSTTPTPSPHRLFAGLALGTLLAALDQTVVATALPRITQELGGLSYYTWIATAYLLTATVFTPLYGTLSDIYGRRRLYVGALAVFVLGSALAATAHDLAQLIAFRALQGVGAAGLLTLAVALIGDVLSARERARYQAYFGGLFALASLLGPPLGGLVTDHLGWRWIFAINIPLGALAAAVVTPALPSVRARPAARVDVTGAVVLVVAVTAVILGLESGGNQWRWSSPLVVGLLGAGTLLLVVFARRRPADRDPVLPLRLFRDRTFAVAAAAGACVGAGMFAAIFFVPLYAEVAHHASAARAGRLLLPLTFAIVLGSLISGRVIARTGRYRVFPVVGTALMTIGFGLLRGADVDTGDGRMAAWLSVLGLGIGLVMQVLVLAVQNSVERRDLGAATSATGFFRSIGGTVGTAALGAVLLNRLGHWVRILDPGATVSLTRHVGAGTTLPDAAIGSFVRALQETFTVAMTVAAVGFLLTLFLPGTALRDRT